MPARYLGVVAASAPADLPSQGESNPVERNFPLEANKPARQDAGAPDFNQHGPCVAGCVHGNEHVARTNRGYGKPIGWAGGVRGAVVFT
jgi:hypothetical protein